MWRKKRSLCRNIPDFPEIQESDIPLITQDNITTAARNIGDVMAVAIQKIQKDSSFEDQDESEKLRSAFQIGRQIKQLLKGKDISNNNGGLPSEDKFIIYCDLIESL